MHRFISWATAALCCAALLFTPVRVQAAAEPPAGYVALTFDDGPSGPITRQLLDGLAQRNVKATFFLCGYRLEKYPDLAAEIAAGGHEIGCHGYSHKLFPQLRERELLQELVLSSLLIQEQTGQTPTLLRPPGGQCSDAVKTFSRQMHLPLILWSVDPRDWECHRSGKVISRVMAQAKDGSIVLMHDMSDCSVSAALAIIDKMQAEGYQFVTVSQLAALSGQSLKPGECYYGLPGAGQSGSSEK